MAWLDASSAERQRQEVSLGNITPSSSSTDGHISRPRASWDDVSLSSRSAPYTAMPETTPAAFNPQYLSASLGDLSKYIALGCLCLDAGLPALPACHGPGSEWVELLSSNLTDDMHLVLGKDPVKLLHAGWLKLFFHRASDGKLVRVFLLPHDVGRRYIHRESKALKASLREVLLRLDISSGTWAGNTTALLQPFDPWATAENVSLFYLFNKLPSPAPDPKIIKCRHTRTAIEEIFQSSSSSPWQEYEPMLQGLKTRLYPYQARSAALMLQRETAPQLQLDPRLEKRCSPTGETYYFGARDESFLREPRYYEANRGGILAETMGLGKTVICLAVILATRDHIPQTPPHYQPPAPVREHVGSLIEMVASTIGRNAIPAKAHVRRLEHAHGIELPLIKDMLERHVPFYEIPADLPRMNRTTKVPPPRRLVMCSGTIIVVPRNLLHQWQSEIKKHVQEGSLKVLVMDSQSKRRKSRIALGGADASDIVVRHDLPTASELLQYDIVLFSRSRFEQEIQDGADNAGRRFTSGAPLDCQCPYIGASRIRDCTCLSRDKLYETPLKKLHWLRIIIDEGHNFSSKNANAVLIAKQIQAERRWVVSGTPAKDLVGVEVDLSTTESSDFDPSMLRELAVEQRKTFSMEHDTGGAAKSLGLLASNFLMVRPWCDSDAEGKVEWDDYIYRHEHHLRKTFSGFSTCFLRVLEGLVVKTRAEDVERDILLPPLKSRVVYLRPSYYDKMTANLFIQVLRANAVTSERTDVDYLFHKNSVQARHRLMANLRQSNFTWTGFSLDDVMSTLETSSKYLAKEDRNCSADDENLLLQSCHTVSTLLQSKGWIALSKAHEVGVFVEDWPQQCESLFGLAYPENPTMIGITQLLEGQAHVDGQILSEDPSEGLEVIGQAAKAKLAALEEAEKKTKVTSENALPDPTQIKTSVPSSFVAQPVSNRRVAAAIAKSSPFKPKTAANQELPSRSNGKDAKDTAAASPAKPRKRRLTTADETAELSDSSPLRNTHVVGTTSAKLTYLIDKVMEHQEKEKIIIFYDGDNAAFYIAQSLELLYVNHRIYSRTLDNQTRSEYVALFNEDPDIRVLLIDVACGALGLNLNVASVVLIVNPINRPGIEAQAIKRAHRIGQTKEVLVETLVLEGTIEEAIFNRARKMSRNEHLEAKTLEDDDKIISIIQNAQIIPIADEEASGAAQFAPLAAPQHVFGRPARAKYQKYGHYDATKAAPEKPKKKQRGPASSKGTKQQKGVSMGRPIDPVEQTQPMPVPPALPDDRLQAPSLFGNGTVETSLNLNPTFGS